MMFEREIREVSQEFEISESLIKAICRKESNFITWASRYEPAWKYHLTERQIAELCKKTSTSIFTEKVHQATSWGLMQVMGTVARELGFEGQLTQLCHPELGLYYGCKKLKSIINRNGYSLEDAVAAYNSGIPVVINGQYKNQQYVNDVMRFYKAFSEEIDG